MIVLGLLLVLIAVGAGAAIFVGTVDMKDQIQFEVLGVTVGLTPLALAVAGAAILLVLWLGFSVLRLGAKRNARKRREAKEKTRLAKEQQAEKEQEWAAERQRVEQERAAAEQQRAAAEQAAQGRLRDRRDATDMERDRAQDGESKIPDGGSTAAS